ncbi:hypothetical protein BUALT_Bualt09G0135600 [Buddleja alternifolia]|uniref:Non-specific lipid-transfer protein n=1 Tax=Buddleja alternifolia TaxID=168488 RepID=A0AAV6X9Q8_9LAMI|nr:hypothetical protein BUALT_Bualt09G0135600 [Buddleja alternifolia]
MAIRLKVTCMVLMVVLVAEAVLVSEAAPISCGTVTSTLAPCFEYVLGGGQVPVNCCTGVKSLYKAASTATDRRTVCTCLKSVTTSASPATIQNAKTLPGKCGVKLPYEISPSIDCNK